MQEAQWAGAGGTGGPGRTHGTPGGVYEASGMYDALATTTEAGILELVGIEVAAHVHFPGVGGSDAATRAQYLDEVESVLASL